MVLVDSLKVRVRQLPKNATELELKHCVDIMNLAFANDEFTRLLVGGYNGSGLSGIPPSPDLLPVRHTASVGAGIIGGKLYVAELDSVGVIGAAVWFGPGEAYLSSPEQREAGFNTFISEIGKLDPEMPKWWTAYFLPAYKNFTSEALADPNYKLDGWHLQLIGVLPEYQSYGVGSALINYLKEEIKNDPTMPPRSRRLSAETETTQALNFYKRLGFIERGETVIDGPEKLKSSAPMWCLSLEL